MPVTVYSKPACMQCEQTKRFMQARGVDFTVVDITQSREAEVEAERLSLKLGRQLPFVVPEEGEPWAGFDYARIKALPC